MFSTHFPSFFLETPPLPRKPRTGGPGGPGGPGRPVLALLAAEAPRCPGGSQLSLHVAATGAEDLGAAAAGVAGLRAETQAPYGDFMRVTYG